MSCVLDATHNPHLHKQPYRTSTNSSVQLSNMTLPNRISFITLFAFLSILLAHHVHAHPMTESEVQGSRSDRFSSRFFWKSVAGISTTQSQGCKRLYQICYLNRLCPDGCCCPGLQCVLRGGHSRTRRGPRTMTCR